MSACGAPGAGLLPAKGDFLIHRTHVAEEVVFEGGEVFAEEVLELLDPLFGGDVDKGFLLGEGGEVFDVGFGVFLKQVVGEGPGFGVGVGGGGAVAKTLVVGKKLLEAAGGATGKVVAKIDEVEAIDGADASPAFGAFEVGRLE